MVILDTDVTIDTSNPRDLPALIDVYLSIIPLEKKHYKYIATLTSIKTHISKRYEYASPEEIGIYWERVNKILETHNTKFINLKNNWATAILYICRYEYDHPSVKQYLHKLKFET